MGRGTEKRDAGRGTRDEKGGRGTRDTGRGTKKFRIDVRIADYIKNQDQVAAEVLSERHNDLLFA